MENFRSNVISQATTSFTLLQHAPYNGLGNSIDISDWAWQSMSFFTVDDLICSESAASSACCATIHGFELTAVYFKNLIAFSIYVNIALLTSFETSKASSSKVARLLI